MSGDIFKTRRQTNRDIIHHSITKKMNALSDRITKLEEVKPEVKPEVDLNFICGESSGIRVGEGKTMTIKVPIGVVLTQSMKVLISVATKDGDSSLGGLSYYLKEYHEGDDSIYVVVDNYKGEREITITYLLGGTASPLISNGDKFNKTPPNSPQ